MRLYKITVEHFSQKDSLTSTAGYVTFEDVNELYDWFLTNPYLNHVPVRLGKDKSEREDFTLEIEHEFTTDLYSYEDAWKKFGGDLSEELAGYMDYDDLYYSREYFGFEDMGEISSNEIDLFEQFGILNR